LMMAHPVLELVPAFSTAAVDLAWREPAKR
jgi:hypothetical protein